MPAGTDLILVDLSRRVLVYADGTSEQVSYDVALWEAQRMVSFPRVLPPRDEGVPGLILPGTPNSPVNRTEHADAGTVPPVVADRPAGGGEGIARHSNCPPARNPCPECAADTSGWDGRRCSTCGWGRES